MTRALALQIAPLLVLVSSGAARAQPSAGADPVCATTRCVAREHDPDNPVLLLSRALLAPPRLLFRTATEVLAIAPRLEDKYHLRRTATDFFFDDARRYGLYPTAFYETGFGPNVGLRFVHRDLFWKREQLLLRVGFGGSYDQIYEAKLDSGARWRAVRLSFGVRYRLMDHGRFFGIGNADEVDVGEVETPLPALDPEAAVSTQYRSEVLQTQFGGSIGLGRAVRLDVSEVLRQQRLSSGPEADELWVPEVYVGGQVLGFERDLVDAYSEVALRWDDRVRKRADLPPALPSAGLRLFAWSGLQHALTEPQRAFGRVGLDVQPFIDLYRGDRVLRLRARTAWVIGDLDRIAFVDLPSLGGARLLRGYGGARFRGRGTLLATVEYRYPVQENLASYLFVDAGRAYVRLGDVSIASLRDARVGFGAGLYVYNRNRATLRLQLASSIDGGLFFALQTGTTDDLGPTY